MSACRYSAILQPPVPSRGFDGTRPRVAVVGLEASANGRTLSRRLRYEHIPTSGEPEVLERVWQTQRVPA